MTITSEDEYLQKKYIENLMSYENWALEDDFYQIG